MEKTASLWVWNDDEKQSCHLLVSYRFYYYSLTQGSPIKVRVFQDRKEAADWLGVPIDRLVTETKNYS